MKEHEQRWLNQLNTLIDEELSQTNFTQTTLIQRMMTSPAQFYRQVVKLTGVSPNRYIRLKRLMKAKDLLERRHCTSIAEVALAVGYQHVNYFLAIYKKQFGRLPLIT